MKKKILCLKHVWILFFCLLIAFTAAYPAKAASPSLNKTSATVKLGKTVKLKVSGASGTVTWKSNKTSVATINSKGVVTAKRAGTAKVTATVGGEKLTCKITVTVDIADYMDGSISKLKKAVGNMKSNTQYNPTTDETLYISTKGDYDSFLVYVGKKTNKIDIVNNRDRNYVKLYGVSIGNSVSAAHKKLLKKGFKLTGTISGGRNYENGTFFVQLTVENKKVTGLFIKRL